MGDLSPSFNRREFSCKCGCGFDTVDAQLLEACESVRQFFGAPVTINSGCRCIAYNARINGSPKSQHLHGRAADMSVKGISPDRVAKLLEDTYPGRFGIGRYKTFTHFDSRGTAARWKE